MDCRRLKFWLTRTAGESTRVYGSNGDGKVVCNLIGRLTDIIGVSRNEVEQSLVETQAGAAGGPPHRVDGDGAGVGDELLHHCEHCKTRQLKLGKSQ